MGEISIIVPVYNAQPYLRACVDSILAQTYTDFELILVDDGSTDGSGTVCDEYAARDGRVRVLHRQNGGVASAVTAGIEAAAGAYIGFVDSDDWVDADYFGQLYRCAAGQDADLAEGQFVIEQDGREPVGASRSATVIYSGEADIRRLAGLYMTSFLYDGVPDRPDRPLTYGRWDKLYHARTLRLALPLYDARLSLGEDALLNASVLPLCGKAVTLKMTARYHHRILAGTVAHKTGEDMARIRALHRSLLRAAAERQLDRDAAAAFIGSMVHARIYRAAELPDVPAGEKCRRMKEILDKAPEHTLEAFVRMRGSAFLRLFYGMLRAGLAAPCVWIVTAHNALSGRKN